MGERTGTSDWRAGVGVGVFGGREEEYEIVTYADKQICAASIDTAAW